VTTDVQRLTAAAQELAAAAQELAAIETPQDAQHVIRFAEAIRVLSRQAKLGSEAENAATAIRLKAEIRLAETVTAGQASGEIASNREGHPGPRDAGAWPATLADLGVDSRRLSEARVIADAFTLPAIDGMTREATERGTTLSRAAVLREARHEANDRFDDLTDSLIDPATRRRHALAKAAAELHGALAAIESLTPEPTAEEAAPMLPTLARLQQKLHGKRTRLEVVS